MKNQTNLFFLFALGMMTCSQSMAKSGGYEKAIEAYNKNDVDTAYIYIKNELQENSNYLPALILLAEILIDKRQYDLAQSELEKAIRLGADSDLVVRLLGQVLLSQAKFEQALTYADKFSLNDSGETNYQLIRAKAYRALERLDEAENVYLKMIENHREEQQAKLGLASVYLTMNRHSDARKQLNELKASAADKSEYWILSGRAYNVEGNMEQAIASYQKAVELEPQNIPALKALAIAYHVDLKDFSKAEETVNKVLAISPYDPHAQLIKSNVLASLDKNNVADQVLIDLHHQLSRIDSQFLFKNSLLLLVDSITSYKLAKWEEARRKFEVYLSKERDVNIAVLLADTYIQLGEHFSAMSLLEDYKQELSSNLDRSLLLASLYLHFNKYFDAANLLSDLERRYPSESTVLIMTAQNYTQRSKHQQALEALERASDTTSPAYQYALATVLNNLARPTEALAKVDALIHSAPNNKDYLLFRARLLVQLEQEQEAERLISDLYAKHSDDKDVAFSYASLLHSKGESEKAQLTLKKLLQTHPKDNQLWFLMASIEHQLGHSEESINILKGKIKDDKMGVALALAKLYYRDNRFTDCIATADTILFHDRQHEQALLLKAKSYIAQKEKRKAEKELAILFSIWSDNIPNLLELSQLQFSNGSEADAEKSLVRALELEPNSPLIYVELIKLKTFQAKLEESDELLKKLLSITPDNTGFVAILQGDLALARNQIAEAFDAYQKAFDLEPDNATAFTKLTRISQGASLEKRYTKLIEQALLQQPNNHFMRHSLADYYLARQQIQPAKYHLQTLLTQKIPNFRRAIALNNLAYVHIKEQHYPLAVELSEQALKIVPQNPDFLDTHGWALTLAQKPTNGLGFLREAYVRNSSANEVKFHLAYALAKIGRLKEAHELVNGIPKFPMGIEEQSQAKELLQLLPK